MGHPVWIERHSHAIRQGPKWGARSSDKVVSRPYSAHQPSLLRNFGHNHRSAAANSFAPGFLTSSSMRASVAAINFPTTLLRWATGLSA